MQPEKTIYLIRHALPDFPGGVKLCLGPKVDLPLGSEGLAQAAALRERFERLPIEAVYASPMRRAQQTAAAIAASGRPLITLDALTELSCGEWDGMSFEEIRRRHPDGMRGALPAGAERDEEGLARMLNALKAIDAGTQRCAALVAHGGVNRLLLCALAGLPLEEKKRFSQDYAGVAAVEKRDGVWRTVVK